MMQAYGGRKLAVTLLGALAGLCLALMLQQAGLVPLDRVAAFGLPAVLAAASFTMLVVRTRFARTITEWIAIVIVLVLVVVAAMGVPARAASGEQGGSTGYLKGSGGCAVQATSGSSSISSPADTSRNTPFDIDPDANISWLATSAVPITNHTWDIWVDVGGFALIVADGGDDNSGRSQENRGDEPVRPYIDDVASYIGGEPAGIYLVGGFIGGDGVSCEGQGWVRLPGGVLANAVGQGATGLFVLVTLLIIILVVKVQRTVVEEVVTRTVTGGGPADGPGGGGPDDDDILGAIGGGDGSTT